MHFLNSNMCKCVNFRYLNIFSNNNMTKYLDIPDICLPHFQLLSTNLSGR